MSDAATEDGQLYNGYLVVVTDAALLPSEMHKASQPISADTIAFARESEQEIYDASFTIGMACPISAQEYNDISRHLTSPRGNLHTALDLLHEYFYKYSI